MAGIGTELASKDTANDVDAALLEVVAEVQQVREVNDAIVSPLMDDNALGGAKVAKILSHRRSAGILELKVL